MREITEERKDSVCGQVVYGESAPTGGT